MTPEEKRAKKKLKPKEVKFKPNIGDHDFETKMKQIHKFLQKGKKVKVTVTFHGREMVHTDLGEDILDNVVENTTEVARIEARPPMKGNNIFLILVPFGWKQQN